MEIFNEAEQEQISHAISLAENRTSGEIRICVEQHCNEETLDRAKKYFEKLGMDKTALKNGVLLYIAVHDKKFAIIGDSGIDAKVPGNFWEDTKASMQSYFKKGLLVDGIITGIASAGEQLRTYFPRADDDINELPNDVVQF